MPVLQPVRSIFFSPFVLLRRIPINASSTISLFLQVKIKSAKINLNRKPRFLAEYFFVHFPSFRFLRIFRAFSLSNNLSVFSIRVLQKSTFNFAEPKKRVFGDSSGMCSCRTKTGKTILSHRSIIDYWNYHISHFPFSVVINACITKLGQLRTKF